MLSVRAIVAVAFLIVWGSVQSEPPSPSPAKSAEHPQAETKNSQQSAEEDKRGTDEAPPVVEMNPSNDTDETTERQRATEDKKAFNDQMVAYATVALAVITLGLAIFTWRLWNATSNLVRNAEITSEKQLRAYLLVKRAYAKRKAEGVFMATVELQNFGQTPAYDVSEWISIRGFDKGEDALIFPKPPPEFQKSKGITAPGNFTIFHIPLFDKMSPAKETALHSGDAAIYVWGEVSYRDAFDRMRITKYRMFLSGEGAKEGRFKIADDGNEAT